MPVFMWRKWYCLWRGAASLWIAVNITSVSWLKSESEYEHSMSPLCPFFISPQRQPSGLAHINSCSHKESILCVITAPEYPALVKNNSLFEDAAINPDCDSLMTSPSLWFWPRSSSCAQTSSTSTGNTQQEANKRPPSLLLLWVCYSAPLWHQGLRHTEPLQDGWHPSCHLLPRSPLQPMHMQLAADNDWMVLHVVWASMKETGSYRSGRQQGWLLTLRAVRRGSEPFSSSAFSARS